MYYRYDTSLGYIPSRYPLLMSEWLLLPDSLRIDASLQYLITDEFFVFAGDQYYRYKVHQPPTPPRPIAYDWFGCRDNTL